MAPAARLADGSRRNILPRAASSGERFIRVLRCTDRQGEGSAVGRASFCAAPPARGSALYPNVVGGWQVVRPEPERAFLHYRANRTLSVVHTPLTNRFWEYLRRPSRASRGRHAQVGLSCIAFCPHHRCMAAIRPAMNPMIAPASEKSGITASTTK